jgi:hypothetical protein
MITLGRLHQIPRQIHFFCLSHLVFSVGLSMASLQADVILGKYPAPPTAEKLQQLRAESERPSVRSVTRGFVVDTSNREEVRNFYNAVYSASENAELAWTGHYDLCLAGSTAASYRDLVATRINFFRAMAGVPAIITLNDIWHTKSQDAALMMSANNALSHTPPPDWNCYSAAGAEAAGNSNIAIGNAGPEAITAYIRDSGNNNAAVGHRRWLFYPQTQTMGTGDVPASESQRSANATWILDANYGTPRPATRHEFVAWPPVGYTPYHIVYPRWSFSHPKASFTSQTTVTVSQQGKVVPVSLEPVEPGAGENTLVWYPSSLDPATNDPWPRPAQDTPYTVTLNNVLISGKPQSFTYDVIVFDPAVSSPGSIETTLTGSATPFVKLPNPYQVTPTTGATGAQVRVSRRAPLTLTEGAESASNSMQAVVSDYPVRSSTVKASGSFSFHLAHPEPPVNQSLTVTHPVLPGSSARLTFKSRLGWATPDQSALVQLSLDEGATWKNIYAQPGSNGRGETTFSPKSVDLSSAAGRSVTVRFVYQFAESGQYYPQTTDGVGWYIDDIAFTQTESLTNPSLTTIPASTPYSFTPNQLENYALEARSQIYDQFFLAWGPSLLVTAIPGAPDPIPVITLDTPPALTATQFECEFAVEHYRPNMVLELLKSPSLEAEWTVDPEARFQPITPATRFRATTPLHGNPHMFYRIQLR